MSQRWKRTMSDDPASLDADLPGNPPDGPSPVDSQLSAFLDGELPPGEVEMLVRRLQREGALKETFGRYALIGETLRTPARTPIGMTSPQFAARVSAALGTEKAPAALPPRAARWFKPAAGLSIAAGVAALAIAFIGQEPATQVAATVAGAGVVAAADPMPEASYIVPEIAVTGPLVPAARLTNYVMAHSEYSSPLGRRNVLSSMLADEPAAADTVPAGFAPDQAPQPVERP